MGALQPDGGVANIVKLPYHHGQPGLLKLYVTSLEFCDASAADRLPDPGHYCGVAVVRAVRSTYEKNDQLQ